MAMTPLMANPFLGAEGSSPAPRARVSAPDPALAAGQAGLRERIGEAFYQIADKPAPSLFAGLLAASFVYGILHALGPGHRKTVVFSLYLARRARAWEPLAMGLALAAIHGGAAALVLFAFRGVAGAFGGKVDWAAAWAEGISYLALLAFGVILSARTALSFFRPERSRARAMTLPAILITGAYPCPGAILVLVLSLRLGLARAGLAAVAAMSAGMSLPVIAAGYLAWFGRVGVFWALKDREALVARVSLAFEIGGYLLLSAFAAYMAVPFISALIR